MCWPLPTAPPYETARSIGTGEDIARWSAYLHCGFNSAAEAGKDTPYYSPYQKLVFGFMEAVAWVYRALLWLGVLAGLACHLRRCPAYCAARRRTRLVPWLLLLGLLGMALLRCAMIAFVEVSSFGIGTSTMYLATVHPLFLLYAFYHWRPMAAPSAERSLANDRPSDPGRRRRGTLR